MEQKEVTSCIQTIELLQQLAYNIHGVMDVVDANNCKKIIDLLKEQEHKDRMFHALEDDWKRLKELLKEQPQIVRCKDCIFGMHEKNESTGMEWIYCGHHRENRPEDWFCASGSRI